MEKTFTSEQVKKIISKAKQLINQIDDDLEEYEEYKKKAVAIASEPSVASGIQEVIEETLKGETNYAIENAKISDLIIVLDQLRISYERMKQLETIKKEKVSAIKKDIANVGPAGSNLKWFFTGKDAKQKAIAAYESLYNFLRSGEYNELMECHYLLDDIENLDGRIAFEDYRNYQSDFRKVLSLLTMNQRISVKSIDEVLELYSKVDAYVLDIENQLMIKKDELKKTADRIISLAAYESLKDISVEELNRSKNGIKTGLLASNGFATIADVYAASVYQLTSVRGISQDGAYTIKSKANELAKAVTEGTHLKVNYDRRTKESTELIKILYYFKNVLPPFNSVFDDIQKSNVKSACKTLKTMDNALQWLFMTEDEQERICEGYSFLVDFYNDTISQTLYELNEGHSVAGHSDEVAWEDFRNNSILYYNLIENLLPGMLGNAETEYDLPEELVREIQEECFFPDGLLCELRRYQEWGVKYILHQKRALLGDEMGLGKTIQAIATMVSLRNVGETHFIVICPASVLANWCREIARHSKLRVTKIHGAGRNSALQSWVKTGGVAVTTYETTSVIQLTSDVKIGLITVDEAHYIKNTNAARSKNVRNLCQYSERLLFMTGTALENKVDEMISLIRVLRPNIADELENLKEVHAAPKFRQLLSPVYFRRKQVDVNNELPEKIEENDYCILQPEERQRYNEAVLSKNYALSRRVSWMMDDLSKSSKALQLRDIVEAAFEEDRKVIVFSFFLDTVTKVKEMFGDICTNPITGSISPDRRQEIIDEFTENSAKRVLVAQIQSGGTGLNIQAGSVVVICEPQLKPSIENQAIARAHRMGQSRTVIVHRLLCENTIEELMMERLAEKQALFNAFADKSVAAEETVVIDDKSFGELIEEEIARIKAETGE